MKIFVGCGARKPNNPEYLKAAESLGAFIAKSGHDLVYGGCDRSMMGAVQSKVAQEPKSDIYIVTCNAYYEDIKSLPYREAYSYPTVNERKNKFNELSDILVYLPGGIGTYDEFFSGLESKKNGEHNYPIFVLNINGYFDPMLAMIDKTIEEGFVGPEVKNLFYVVSTIEEFKKAFFEYTMQ